MADSELVELIRNSAQWRHMNWPSDAATDAVTVILANPEVVLRELGAEPVGPPTQIDSPIVRLQTFQGYMVPVEGR